MLRLTERDRQRVEGVCTSGIDGSDCFLFCFCFTLFCFTFVLLLLISIYFIYLFDLNHTYFIGEKGTGDESEQTEKRKEGTLRKEEINVKIIRFFLNIKQKKICLPLDFFCFVLLGGSFQRQRETDAPGPAKHYKEVLPQRGTSCANDFGSDRANQSDSERIDREARPAALTDSTAAATTAATVTTSCTTARPVAAAAIARK